MFFGEKAGNAHVTDNVYGIMAGAAAKFNAEQFDHLPTLIRRAWERSNDRVREKLPALIGRIGKEANTGSPKSTQAILALLWEMAHLPALPKSLVESALSEQLSILTEMRTNKDPMRRAYVLKCVDDIKQHRGNNLFAVKHLHNIFRTSSGAA